MLTRMFTSMFVHLSMHVIVLMPARTDTQVCGIDTTSTTPPELMAALIASLLGGDVGNSHGASPLELPVSQNLVWPM